MTQVAEKTTELTLDEKIAALQKRLGMPTLVEEIATLLKEPAGVSAEKFAGIINRAKLNATVAENSGRAARLRSVDPRCVDGVAERSKAEDQEFIALRLKNAVEALEPHYQAAIRKDELEQWTADTQDIRLRLDALSKELQTTYTECVDKLIDVFQRCESINHEARQFASAAAGPIYFADRHRLLSVGAGGAPGGS